MERSIWPLLIKLLMQYNKLHNEDDGINELPYTNFNDPKLLLPLLVFIINPINYTKNQKRYTENHVGNTKYNPHTRVLG